MRRIPSLSFLAPLMAAALLTGCGVGYRSYPGGGYPGDYPRGPEGTYGRSGDRFGDLRGTVESVNTRERLIYVDREGDDPRYNLQNDGGGQDEVVIAYDQGTSVRYQGRDYRPEDLERGDRIQASIDRSGNNGRLFASNIDVLYDVSEGGPGGYDNNNGGYGDRDVRTDVRGTVRSIDTRSRTLEIDRSDDGPDPGGYSDSRRGTRDGRGQGHRVLVYYDPNTSVRYQGRLYSPENIERGDEVEIQARDLGGRLVAQEITVVGEGSSGR